MLSENVKLSFEDIISSLHNLNKVERIQLQCTLFELQSDLDLKEAILEGLADKRSGRVSSHDEILREIREKHHQ